ncbi:mechanosensitive ion channel family protein [Niabella ginsengisoli]|uniref:Mechanosensitive ion channel n=1 Tax=Niabella ginsengisoli TaxID=522298 RepID=A0ABS9SJS0_9BACT|nr:mechanosensitive ion channel domain-containing protein [Niabella ginsengisoli]MCH5598571.1 mechanosensitive ion channel [Niabella ginsengisoli]
MGPSSAAQQIQHSDSASKPDATDSTINDRIAAVAAKERKKSTEVFQAGKTAMQQRKALEHLVNTAQQAKLYLKSALSLSTVKSELKSIEASYDILKDGIFVNKGTAQTDRNLSVSSAILYQLVQSLSERKKQIDDHLAHLSTFRNDIDSTLNIASIYNFPTDSIALKEYVARLKVIKLQGDPIDNDLNAQLKLIHQVQDQADYLLFTLKSSYEEIEKYRNDLSQFTLREEFAPLWKPVLHFRPFGEIIKFSLEKEKLALKFYFKENGTNIFILILLVLLVYIWLRALKRKYPDGDRAGGLVTKKPFLSSLIIVISVYQFTFINAPFIFNACLWIIAAACLLAILKDFIAPYWNRFLWVISLFFLLACLDNLILQSSRPERWIMLFLSMAGIIYGSYILINGHHSDLKEKRILPFIRIVVFIEILSLLANVLGWYNLSKTLLTTGYISLIIGILFIWVIRLLNEALALSSEIYQHTGRKLFYINFSRVGSKVPFIFNVFLVIGWLIITGKNFYVFKRVGEALGGFLHKERALGDYSFSIDGIVLFIVIAYSSMLISRIVSFFGAEPMELHGSTSTKSTVSSHGSWILLLRIFVISLGLFLAFAASGLPIDKITIVLGALGVGIGLGLQGLVSNLVSGLIIAFERPVNVGDLIELNGKSGTMKSIGFRSSIVTLGDGSSLIVPNGDLLNQHMINWSLSKNIRKVVLSVGVAYGSDLTQVKELLEQVAQSSDKVLQVPPCSAFARKFGESSVDFDLIFWVRHPFEAVPATSDVITAIDVAFRKANIEIPFPQQDIRVFSAESQQGKSDERK